MRKIIIGVALTALFIPASALARTPASGAKKATIVTAAFRGLDRNASYQVDVSPRQTRQCFNVWTYRRFGLVDVNRKYGRGLCDIKAHFKGCDGCGWQPVNLITHDTHGRWGLRADFDQVEKPQLRRWHIPVSVVLNLFHIRSDKSYPFVP